MLSRECISKLFTTVFIFLISLSFPVAGEETGQHRNEQEGEWLMLVGTDVTDPNQEDAFNRWYDDIDIPDVLNVPGYQRARRGVVAALLNDANINSSAKAGKYIALYTIDSGDMDGTIIKMLLASWNMEKQNRSTGLILVKERAYYHRYGKTYDRKRQVRDGRNDYMVVIKADCCKTQSARNRFNKWFEVRYMPALTEVIGLKKATRYDLHRVVMLEQKTVPDFLGVYEIMAASAEAATANISTILQELDQEGRKKNIYQQRSAIIYHKIKDVRRQEWKKAKESQ